MTTYLPLSFHQVDACVWTRASRPCWFPKLVLFKWSWNSLIECKVLLQNAWLPLKRWLEWMCFAMTRQEHLPGTSWQ
jgi:hypothetical protein